MNRRQFGKSAILAGIGGFAFKQQKNDPEMKEQDIQHSLPLKNKIALNAFSFNAPLTNKSMDLFDMLDFCSRLGFDGVDLTGYYFPGYPESPPDEFIYSRSGSRC